MALRTNGISLCSGVGGLELGLHRAIPDYRTILWCENDERTAATLISNFNKGLDEAPIWDDVRTLDGSAWRGLVDVLTAGFPCQPFSQSGQRKGEDDERHLWPHILRVIRDCEPTQVFVENVPGIITTTVADGRPAAIVVREDLECLGYRVEEGLFSAAEVGAPQRRLRWFALAHTENNGCKRPGQARGRWDGLEDSSPSRLVGNSRERREPVGAGPDEWTAWPPSPESDEWPEFLQRHPYAAPATESCVRGDADGLASGMDVCLCGRTARLRQTGNGVVPMTAALAYLTLKGRFNA